MLIPISPMQPMEPMRSLNAPETVRALNASGASFLDVFRGLVDNVIETNEQVDRDAIDLMLGNIDDLAEVQTNIEKANIAVDLLVTVKNETISAFNSILNMQI